LSDFSSPLAGASPENSTDRRSTDPWLSVYRFTATRQLFAIVSGCGSMRSRGQWCLRKNAALAAPK